MNKTLALLTPLTLLSVAFAQAAPRQLTDAQLLAGSKNFMERYLSAVSKNNGPQIAAFYHDNAVISVQSHSSNGQVRTLEMTGVQYKTLVNTIPLTEAPDRYTNLNYKILGKNVVEVTTQRQSVSRGYTAPNIFYLQPDMAGRFWIIGEKGVQRVK